MINDSKIIYKPRFSHTESENVNRRLFLKGLTVSPLVMAYPQLALSRELGWKDIRYVLKLNFVRFVAGLLFDVVEVVVVNYFNLRREDHNYYDYANLPTDKDNFHHAAYKKAVIQIHPVRYGMSEEEYQAYRTQKNKIVLTRDEDNLRFEIIQKHLIDTKTRIAFVGDNASRKITVSMQANDLFNINYLIFKNENAELHYQELLEKTQVKVFEKLVT